MHKFLAFLLAVLMVVGVFSVMPISAVEGTVSAFDKTKASTDSNGLIITEILVNSKSNTWRDDYSDDESVTVFSSPDAMDYIEVYNAGDRPVNIYDYCILSAPYLDFVGKGSGVPYRFTYQNLIVRGDIHSAENGADESTWRYNTDCENVEDGEICPGEMAVIWFWTGATDAACNDLGYSLGDCDLYGDRRTFPHFRDHYGMDKDVKIFVTNAKRSAGTRDLFNSLECDYIYALARSNYNIDDIAVSSQYADGNADGSFLHRYISCMASYTMHNSVGITSTDNMDNVSAYYVPAACTPDLINENVKPVDPAYKPVADYVQAGCALSYRETAIISFCEKPSPGGMPSWQWQYIEQGASLEHDPDNYVYGYGLAYIDQFVFDRAESLVFEMTQYVNHGEWLWSITGKPYGVKGNYNMTAQEKAAQTMKFYNQLMDCYVSDWLDADGNAANTRIVGADGRLITTKTGETYDWVAAADAYMKEIYACSYGDETTGRTEIKKDYAAGFVDREVLAQKWMKVIPQVRVNEVTRMWEISYNEGATWTSLDVVAIDDSVQTPILRSKSYYWEVSYDGGKSWDYLLWSATSVPSPRLRINTDTDMWEISYDRGETWSSLNVRATKDIVPQLRIDALSNEWQISYDGGTVWHGLGAKATGADGIVPVVRIHTETKDWEVSYDNGISWEPLGVSGEKKNSIMPELRINDETVQWEISYDGGVSWRSLGVDAAGKSASTPQLRINGLSGYWEISYDGKKWGMLEAKATGENGVMPRLQVNALSNEWEVTYDDGATWIPLDVKATGEQGISPKLRIHREHNEWEISYDNGTTWASLGVSAFETEQEEVKEESKEESKENTAEQTQSPQQNAKDEPNEENTDHGVLWVILGVAAAVICVGIVVLILIRRRKSKMHTTNGEETNR